MLSSVVPGSRVVATLVFSSPLPPGQCDGILSRMNTCSWEVRGKIVRSSCSSVFILILRETVS